MLSPRAKVSGMLAEGDAAGTGRKVYIDATAPFNRSDRYERGRFENVAIESQDLVVEYTASWPESVRYYPFFRKADGT